MNKRNLPSHIKRKLKKVPKSLRNLYLVYLEDCAREQKRLDEVFKSVGDKNGKSEDKGNESAVYQSLNGKIFN